MKSFLPYGRQVIDKDDIDAVVSVLKSDWLTTGPQVEAFETDLARECNVKYVISCTSATAGLHMAAMALDLGPRKTVVVPSITFLASASSPHLNGASIIFADVDPESGLITPATFIKAIKSHSGFPIKAVIPMHLAGRVCDMEGIKAIADQFEIAVIEDACHALGADYADTEGKIHKVGSCAHSDIAVFSFHPVKAIAAGEGGAICTESIDLANKLRLSRNHGIVRDPTLWVNKEFGFDDDGQANPWFYELHAPMLNYRMSDINAALANSQLKKLKHFVDRRAKLAEKYDALLEQMCPQILPPVRQLGNNLGWHLYSIRVEFTRLGISRKGLIEFLREHNIGSQVHYIPLQLQPYWKKMGWGHKDFSGAMRYYERTLSLPIFPSMEEDDVSYVVENLKNGFEYTK